MSRKEIWKPVILLDTGESYPNYEVRNIKTGKILKASKDKNNYFVLKLYKDGKGKQYKVHRLVAFAFVDGWFEGAEVDHIDTNKEKNIYTNLKWVTRKENNNNPLTRKHNSESQKGKEPINKGVPMSEEQKRKLSELRMGKYTDKDNPNFKGFIAIYPDGTITEVMTKVKLSEYLGINITTMSDFIKIKKPYKVSKNIPKKNKEHLKTLEGIRILTYENYLNEVK